MHAVTLPGAAIPYAAGRRARVCYEILASAAAPMPMQARGMGASTHLGDLGQQPAEAICQVAFALDEGIDEGGHRGREEDGQPHQLLRRQERASRGRAAARRRHARPLETQWQRRPWQQRRRRRSLVDPRRAALQGSDARPGDGRHRHWACHPLHLPRPWRFSEANGFGLCLRQAVLRSGPRVQAGAHAATSNARLRPTEIAGHSGQRGCGATAANPSLASPPRMRPHLACCIHSMLECIARQACTCGQANVNWPSAEASTQQRRSCRFGQERIDGEQSGATAGKMDGCEECWVAAQGHTLLGGV